MADLTVCWTNASSTQAVFNQAPTENVGTVAVSMLMSVNCTCGRCVFWLYAAVEQAAQEDF
jgi:hypothetical protein